MKIICNKQEFAEMVRNCYKSNSCTNCLLSGLCDGQNCVVTFADVVEESEEEG